MDQKTRIKKLYAWIAIDEDGNETLFNMALSKKGNPPMFQMVTSKKETLLAAEFLVKEEAHKRGFKMELREFTFIESTIAEFAQ